MSATGEEFRRPSRTSHVRLSRAVARHSSRGKSDLSVAHSFVASGLLALPLDFWVSGVAQVTSGVHFSGGGALIDHDGDGIFSTRPANTQRNEFRGPATFNLDLRVEKKFPIGGGYTPSVLIEVFNVTNARNPFLIDTAFVSGSPGPDFGSTQVPLPGREVQIGIRFQF